MLAAILALTGCNDLDKASTAAFVNGTAISDATVAQVATQFNTSLATTADQKIKESQALGVLILAPFVLNQVKASGSWTPDARYNAALQKIPDATQATKDFIATSIILAQGGPLTETDVTAILDQLKKADVSWTRGSARGTPPPGASSSRRTTGSSRPRPRRGASDVRADGATDRAGARARRARRPASDGSPVPPAHQPAGRVRTADPRGVAGARHRRRRVRPRGRAPGRGAAGLRRHGDDGAERGGDDVLGRDLVARAAAGEQVVWVVSSDGDPGLTDVVAGEVSRLPSAPDVEVLLGSHDVPGARLLDLVAVMDRLRSPGGCPWDRAQTHTSLVPYLIEEAHEAAEALESGRPRPHGRGAR